MPETYDHDNKPVKHHRGRINGLLMHYITAGQGPALLLLHGTPKTHYYWHKLVPLLTPHFSIVAPDLRGFGATSKPPASDGYDSRQNADDMLELMSQCKHERFHVHGEDRGAEFAYAVAAAGRDRVITLSFCEMLLSGLGLEEQTIFKAENITAQYEQRGVWNWHIPFFWIPHLPEILITGKEDEFWTHFMVAECYNPTAITEEERREWIMYVKQPGGLRGILETYRAQFKNAEFNQEQAKKKLTCPVMTVGAPEFFGPLVKENMLKVAESVERSEIFEECGHSLSLEKEHRLAEMIKEFMLNR